MATGRRVRLQDDGGGGILLPRPGGGAGQRSLTIRRARSTFPVRRRGTAPATSPGTRESTSKSSNQVSIPTIHAQYPYTLFRSTIQIQLSISTIQIQLTISTIQLLPGPGRPSRPCTAGTQCTLRPPVKRKSNSISANL